MKTCGQCERFHRIYLGSRYGNCIFPKPTWVEAWVKDSPLLTGDLINEASKQAEHCDCFEPTEPKEDECSSNK